ncbi:MAG: site-specific integrase [Chloroflexi bacterium]|nr:site-specific integrase [Chloroflexota bacterium]
MYKCHRAAERAAELRRLWRSLRPHDILPAVYSWRRGQAPRQFTTNGISQMLVRRGKKADIPLFRTHALRHAKINRSRKIVGPKLASSLVDHSSMTTTLGYIYVDDDELEQATVATGLQHDYWNGHRA